jgi:hypothetical protein
VRKTVKTFLIILGCPVGAAALLLIVSSILYSPEYVYRCVVNGESKITDYKIFPEHLIAKSSKPYSYAYDLDETLGETEFSYQTGGELKTQALDYLLEQIGTTSCIVIRGDKVLSEEDLG